MCVCVHIKLLILTHLSRILTDLGQRSSHHLAANRYYKPTPCAVDGVASLKAGQIKRDHRGLKGCLTT